MATLFITGAARGIGHRLVERAVSRGDIVFAGVRKEADFSKFPAADNLHMVIIDVSNTESVDKAFLSIDERLHGRKLDAVINPAAISMGGVLEAQPLDEIEQHLNTNALGSLRLAKAALPRLRGHGGRLIFVTSLWGKAAAPMVGAYCASKHTVEAYADVLRRETVGQNVHIVVCEPGVVMTDMYTTQEDDVKRLAEALPDTMKPLYYNMYQRYLGMLRDGGKLAISADKAAQWIEKPVFAAKPKRRYQFGIDSKLACFLVWLLPDAIFDFALGRSMNNKPV